MTRKRFVKLLMSCGFTRNAATFRARFYIPSMYSSYLECYRVMAGLDKKYFEKFQKTLDKSHNV